MIFSKSSTMKLETEREKTEFLIECYKNIKRISSGYKFVSGKSSLDEYVYIEDSKEKLDNQLPARINLSTPNMRHTEIGVNVRLKHIKLELLVAIYNKVAQLTKSNDLIDLRKIFTAIKGNSIFFGNLDINENYSYISKAFFSVTNNSFFIPEEATFLKKYGYLEIKNNNLLHNAVNESDLVKVQALLDSSPKPDVDGKDNYGYGNTPLYHAVWSDKNLEIAKTLIAYGAQVNNNYLNLAIENGNIEMVRLLLANGCDVNNTDSEGVTPLRKILNVVDDKMHRWSWSPSEILSILTVLTANKINWEAHHTRAESIFEAAKKCFSYIQKKIDKSNYYGHVDENICKELSKLTEFFQKGEKEFRSYVEIQKNSRTLAENYRDSSSFFYKLPAEINIKIAGLTGEANSYEGNQPEVIAETYFKKS